MTAISNVQNHSVYSVSSPTPASATEDNTTLIANGMNAFWLLFADSSDPKLGWKSSVPYLNGFGLGNPNLSPGLQSILTNFFASEIGTFDSPSPLMRALEQSHNTNENRLFQALNHYRVGKDGLSNFTADLKNAVATFQKTRNYPNTPMGQILDVIQNDTPKRSYPETYVPGLPPTDPYYPESTTKNFINNMNGLSTLDPAHILQQLQKFGTLILGVPTANSSSTYSLCGGDVTGGNRDVDPMDMLIYHLLSTNLGGPSNLYLANYAYAINDGKNPDPSTPDGKAFFDAFLPGGLGSLLPILGYYVTSMMK